VAQKQILARFYLKNPVKTYFRQPKAENRDFAQPLHLVFGKSRPIRPTSKANQADTTKQKLKRLLAGLLPVLTGETKDMENRWPQDKCPFGGARKTAKTSNAQEAKAKER